MEPKTLPCPPPDPEDTLEVTVPVIARDSLDPEALGEDNVQRYLADIDLDDE